MLHRKTKKPRIDRSNDSVRKEMAKPRMARSARIAELSLDIARIPEQPSITMPGTVEKIIRLLARVNPKKRRLVLTGPTTAIEISVSKTR
jgi:hypothetical protein